MELLGTQGNDGSRLFWSASDVWPFEDFCDRLKRISGLQLTRFVSDGADEAWVDFTFAGFSFTVNHQPSEWWYFSNDSDCPDSVLLEVANLVSK